VASLSSVHACHDLWNVVPGLLLIGFGVGLFSATATNSVVGSVPQGDSGTGRPQRCGLQVGGALGVAVIGSVMSTRYRDHMIVALAGRHVPDAISHTILGSLGGALAVAASAGGATGASSRMRRVRVHERRQSGVRVGAAVAVGGAALVVTRLPSRFRTKHHTPHKTSRSRIPVCSRHRATTHVEEITPVRTALDAESTASHSHA